MQRWHVTAFCLSLAIVGPMGCALNTSPGEQARTSQTFTQVSAFLTAVDVDVLDDRTLITLQSDAPLRYAVHHDQTPPRLVIDLPEHRIAPGVRPLEVFRGGVTGVYPQQVAEQGGSQVEIGLVPGVTHSWSSPSTSTLLVEIRSDPSAPTRPATSEGLKLKNRISGAVSADRSVSPPKGKETFTLGRTTPGNAERATEVIGIAVEPSGDRTLVRVIGNGPILVYKTERPTHPSQFVLSLPSLTTALSGQSLDTSTPHLKQVTVRPPDTEGTTIEITLGSSVAPQIVRDGAQVVVEVTGRPASHDAPSMARGPRLMPVSAQKVPGAAPPDPLMLAQRPGVSPKTSEGAPIYTGQRISLDFQQADLIDVLRLIAEVSGMNIITSKEVTGQVTTRMVNVPWDQALDTILKTFRLGKDQEGSIIRVVPLEQLRKERDDELQSKRVVEELEAPVTRTIQLNYARAEELKSNMEKLLTKQGRLDVDKRTNTIIVKDISSTVDEVLELIRRLDSQTRQVSIETRIVETARTFLQELGIRWGGFVNQETGVKFPRQVVLTGRQPEPGGVIPTNPLAPPGTFGNFAVDLPTFTQPPALAIGLALISNSSIIDMELQALERNGRGRIVSAPKVVTLDNKEAVVESGDEVPFKTESADSGPKVEFKDAMITLKVTPHISPDDYVLLEVYAAKKEVDFSRTVEGNPTITSRQSKTSVLVKDGATVVMGGLFKQQSIEQQEGIPGLSKIPYLGWLFKTKQTRNDNEDLLFFITPRIVRGRQEPRSR
jgi:type IV pilus secretin PilQ/predicted competence protein